MKTPNYSDLPAVDFKNPDCPTCRNTTIYERTTSYNPSEKVPCVTLALVNRIAFDTPGNVLCGSFHDSGTRVVHSSSVRDRSFLVHYGSGPLYGRPVPYTIYERVLICPHCKKVWSSFEEYIYEKCKYHEQRNSTH